MMLIILNSETLALKRVLLRESCFLRKINVMLSNINFNHVQKVFIYFVVAAID